MQTASHPFAELIDLKVDEQGDGHSRLTLAVAPAHLNPHRVVHGAVLYALADTGMGAALYPSLALWAAPRRWSIAGAPSPTWSRS